MPAGKDHFEMEGYNISYGPPICARLVLKLRHFIGGRLSCTSGKGHIDGTLCSLLAARIWLHLLS